MKQSLPLLCERTENFYCIPFKKEIQVLSTKWTSQPNNGMESTVQDTLI